MNPLTMCGVKDVAVEQIDLQSLGKGQTVEVVTQLGTFWVTRTDLSRFTDDCEHGARRMAVGGSNYRSVSPIDTNTTRLLRVGEMFSIRHGMRQTEATVMSIRMPVQ